MDKIIVKHSSIIINDYNLGDSPRLESWFKLYDEVYHKYYFKGLYYDKDNYKLYLPRGMNIIFLEEIFNEKAKIDYNCNKFVDIGQVKLRKLPRNDRQKKALRFMLGKEEYKSNEFKSQFGINLPTGFGKTYCSIAVIAFLQIKPIIITSSISWLKQWKSCIQEYTDIKKNEIYLISGKRTVDNLLYDRKYQKQYRILLASDSTLKAYGDEEGWDKITKLFQLNGIGLKFYDEAHLHFDNLYKIDFFTNVYKSYYLTASPERSDDDENKIYQIYFKNIPEINMFDKKLDAHVNYISIKYNSKPSPFQISKCRNKYGLNKNLYANYVVNQDNYYKLLVVLLSIALSHEGKILVFIGTNDAINTTKKWLIDEFPELNGNIGVYTSIIKENKEEELNNKIILSTTKSAGTAKDIKNLKFVIVLAEPFKSRVLAKQSLGRCRDSNTYYQDIVDLGFRDINRWNYNKMPIFNKYAKSKSNISFNDNDLDKEYNKIINYIYDMRKQLQNKIPLFIESNKTLLFVPVTFQKNKYILYK